MEALVFQAIFAVRGKPCNLSEILLQCMWGFFLFIVVSCLCFRKVIHLTVCFEALFRSQFIWSLNVRTWSQAAMLGGRLCTMYLNHFSCKVCTSFSTTSGTFVSAFLKLVYLSYVEVLVDPVRRASVCKHVEMSNVWPLW